MKVYAPYHDAAIDQLKLFLYYHSVLGNHPKDNLYTIMACMGTYPGYNQRDIIYDFYTFV